MPVFFLPEKREGEGGEGRKKEKVRSVDRCLFHPLPLGGRKGGEERGEGGGRKGPVPVGKPSSSSISNTGEGEGEKKGEKERGLEAVATDILSPRRGEGKKKKGEKRGWGSRTPTARLPSSISISLGREKKKEEEGKKENKGK